jgi:hypothetical protein
MFYAMRLVIIQFLNYLLLYIVWLLLISTNADNASMLHKSKYMYVDKKIHYVQMYTAIIPTWSN